MIDLIMNKNPLFRELLRAYLIDNHAVKAFKIGKRYIYRNRVTPNNNDKWVINYSFGDVREFCKYLLDNGYTYKFISKVENMVRTMHTQVRILVIERKS